MLLDRVKDYPALRKPLKCWHVGGLSSVVKVNLLLICTLHSLLRGFDIPMLEGFYGYLGQSISP